MSNPCRILFVDDESQLLKALTRVFRSKDYSVRTAESGEQGLALLKEQVADVIISDMRMPGMDGATFLAESLEVSPSSRRILLTGYSDHDSTISAINKGKIHQYLNKPWDNDELKSTVDSEFREIAQSPSEDKSNLKLKDEVSLVKAELSQAHLFADMAKDELLNQYKTTIKIISNLINLKMPSSAEQNTAVVSHSVALSKLIKLDTKVITEIRNAAMLHQIGKLTIPDNLVNRKIISFSPTELKEYNQHSHKGADLLLPLSSLEFAAKLIRFQNENFDGSGFPGRYAKNAIPLGSRILRITIDFHQIVYGQFYDKEYGAMDALTLMKKDSGIKYDPTLLSIYERFIIELSKTNTIKNDFLVDTSSLKSGMKVTRDIFNNDGLLLVTKGTVLNDVLIRKLLSLQSRDDKNIDVFVDTAEIQ